MGFIRQQEEKLAVRFLSWQYEELKKPIPDETELASQADAQPMGLRRRRRMDRVLIALLAQRYIVRGLTMGAVRG